MVGGHAVNAYGFYRTTFALDLLIRPTPANAARTVQARRALGYGPDDFEEDDFLRVPSFLTFGYQGEWVDLMTQIDGVDFAECWDGATVIAYEGVLIRFISLRALRRAKAATGRPKDLDDLENLPPVADPPPPPQPGSAPPWPGL